MESERYQIQFCSDQRLLQPDCPVHVQKLQCTRDNLTGSFILQVRYVNRTAFTVNALVICVRQTDGCGKEVAMIRSLPVPGLQVKPHSCFGDDKTVILSTASANIQVLVEQVRFSDGHIWRIKPEDKPVLVQPPIRVCGKLQPSRHDGYWYCGCGLVNPASSAVCDYCGKPAPVLQSAATPETPEAPVEPTPSQDWPDTPTKEEIQAAEQEFPVIPRTLPPVVKNPPQKKRRGLIWLLVALLILAILAAAAYFIVYPMFQYYQASHLYDMGQYGQAAEIFQSVSQYKDAGERVSQCKFNMAYELLQSGDYAQACQDFLALTEDDRSHSMALTCLQQQFLAAQEHNNPEQAQSCLDKVNQILKDGEQPPAWLKDAQGWVSYQEGLAFYESGEYQRALDCFAESEYGDSQQYIPDCRYHLAQEMLASGEVEAAIDALQSLGDYQDSQTRMYQAMEDYVRSHFNADDEKTAQYLQALVSAGVEGAQALYDELYAWSAEFACNGVDESLDSLALLTIDYSVTAGHPDGGTVDFILEYTLPNGQTGSFPMAENVAVGDSGTFSWSNTGIVDASKGEFALTITENYGDRVLYKIIIHINS